MNDFEAIGAALKTRLLTCTVAQGAETNLGAGVHRGRRHIDTEAIPCSVLVEGASEPVERRRGRNGDQYVVAAPYAVHAYVPCDPDNPNIAGHAAMRDVLRALFRDPSLGGLLTDLEFVGTDILPHVEGQAFVLAVVEFRASLHMVLSSP